MARYSNYEALAAESEVYRRQTAWLDGFSVGAGFLPIPEKYLNDPDFSAGWKVGREAKRDAVARAEYLYKRKVGVITIQ